MTDRTPAKVDSAPELGAARDRCAGCGREEDRPHPALCVCGLENAWILGSSVADAPRSLADAPRTPWRRWPTGEAELDALLAGGWAPGESALLHGPRGSGKTRCALRWSSAIGRSVVVELELSETLLREIAVSAGARLERLFWSDLTDPAALRGYVRRVGARVLVVDSLSRADRPVELGRAVARLASELGIVCLAIAHENKRGRASGPSALEHDPDAVCRVTPSGPGVALVRLTKRRLGPLGQARVPILSTRTDGPGSEPPPPRSRKARDGRSRPLRLL